MRRGYRNLRWAPWRKPYRYCLNHERMYTRNGWMTLAGILQGFKENGTYYQAFHSPGNRENRNQEVLLALETVRGAIRECKDGVYEGELVRRIEVLDRIDKLREFYGWESKRPSKNI